MEVIALAVVLGVAVAGVVGWSWQAGTGTVRPGSGEPVRPADVGLPGDDFGAAATLLLFTSRQDDRTAPVRAALQELTRPGVALAEVDLTTRGDLAGRYAVTRTPSLLVLDGDGRLRARVKGPAGPDVLRDALAVVLHPA